MTTLTIPARQAMDQLQNSTDAKDHALFIALASLERIAGLDSCEGGRPQVDAIRNLARAARLLGETESRTL